MSFRYSKKSGSKSHRFCGGRERRFEREDNKETRSRWLKFWRKLKGDNKNKNKKNSFNSSSVKIQQPYDPETYMKNFDDGESTMEPENLFRSFSARYADPSKSCRRKKLWG